jgi:hypothetical protein
VAYFLALRKYRLIGLSTVFSLVVLVLFILAEIRKRHFYLGAGASENPWALIHILFMSLAFAVFSASFFIGLVYLLQQSQLKGRHPGALLSRLPSLETTDAMHLPGVDRRLRPPVHRHPGRGRSVQDDRGPFLPGRFQADHGLGHVGPLRPVLECEAEGRLEGPARILLSILGFAGVVLAFLTLEHRVM